MKPLFYLLPLLLLAAVTSCNKDKNENKTLTTNTWSFSIGNPDRTTIFGMKDMEVSIQGNGRVRIRSKQGSLSGSNGNGGDNCDVDFYFKSIPLSSKVYKITTIERIANHDDEVAVLVNVSGDPSLASRYGSAWLSVGDGSQTMDYKFADGKCSFNVTDIKVRCESNYVGEQDALFSANIKQP